MVKLSCLLGMIMLPFFFKCKVEGNKNDVIFIFDSTVTGDECACEKAVLKAGINYWYKYNSTTYSIKIGIVYYNSTTATIAYGLSTKLNLAALLSKVDSLPCSGGTTGAIDVAFAWNFNMFLNGGQSNSQKNVRALISHSPTTPAAVTTSLNKLETLGAATNVYFTQNNMLTSPISGIPETITQASYTTFCVMQGVVPNGNFP